MEQKKKISMIVVCKRILLVAIICMIPVLGYEAYKYKMAAEEYDSIPDIDITDMPSAVGDAEVFEGSAEEWPTDALFVTEERADYQGGDMLLTVERMNLKNIMVGDGTTKEVLKQGPGLYVPSQLPGEGDRNVSIAGHRTGYRGAYNIFYDIDKLQEKDEISIVYGKERYIYRYYDTKVVAPEDISVLYLQGFSCLTLTSCHPIGVNDQRIVVRAALVAIENMQGERREIESVLPKVREKAVKKQEK